ncbi:ABC transporter ATP-binding protein [Labedella phragmitis]|uniref:ABC transporter ATP-binding protein n=1 Tax=Labedella phragmitis TaxID=2498849 RepID=A0A3S4AIY5_9MICO|nr:ABC transporter ATP-binding protein [Labedella phragmitis]RWZ49582.1 ABC transporter ATP-binding protein [Labedella phragmitis]
MTTSTPRAGTPLARLDGVSRRFGDTLALDDVTLEIAPGCILGLLGPNGAGKSTILSLLDGRRRPTSGRVELFGRSPSDPVARQRLGCTPQETGLPDTLRVSEVIDFVGAHFEQTTETTSLVEEFGLAPILKKQTGALSGGQRRRLAVALAFVGNPRLVLLDEPTTGLDVEARHTLWDALRRQHDRGATIVVTSHYLEEIEALAERVVVVGAGRVLADGTLAEIIGRAGLQRVSITTSEAQRIARLPGVVRHERDGDDVTFWVRDSDVFVRELIRSDLPFRGIAVRGATLEEAFVTLTGAAEAATRPSTGRTAA